MTARTETLAAVSLTKHFGDVVALSDVSFQVEGPGLVGILGPNGAGKTTLLDILEGLSPPSSGSFRLFGAAPEPYPRGRVGVVLQNEAKLERVTTREYAELFAAIYGASHGADGILARAELEDRRALPVSKLSGGEAARLYIATATVHEPELLLLDEPTAHLDPESKRVIGGLLRRLAEKSTVLMTTHDLSEADELCDELLFLVGGELRASGRRDELVGDEGMEEAFFRHCAIHIRDGEATS